MIESLKSFGGFASAVATFIAGQAPAWISFFGGHLSFYQPAIYKDMGYLLLLPCVVGVLCTWVAFTYRSKLAVWLLAGGFIVSLLLAHFIRNGNSFSADHWIHPLNWALFYCAIAMAVAMLARISFDLWSFAQNHG